jgi:hypothetical protein
MIGTQPSQCTPKRRPLGRRFALILLALGAVSVAGLFLHGRASSATNGGGKTGFYLLAAMRGPKSERVRFLHVGKTYTYSLQMLGPEKQQMPLASLPRVVFAFGEVRTWARLGGLGVRGVGYSYCSAKPPHWVRLSDRHTAIDFGKCYAFDLLLHPTKRGFHRLDVQAYVVRVRDRHYEVLETPKWGSLHWSGVIRP